MLMYLAAVESAVVVRLRGREPSKGPAQVQEMRFPRVGERVHPDLFRQAVALLRVARAAGGDNVRPLVRSTAGQRHQVIAREPFARLELRNVPATELAFVAIAREQKG